MNIYLYEGIYKYKYIKYIYINIYIYIYYRFFHHIPTISTQLGHQQDFR
jgi:hypothetical protein